MNRAELIDKLAARLEKSRAEVAETVDAALDEIKHAVTKGEKVQVAGFGIFENIGRSARTARNPQTGATVKVKATKVPKFRPASDFKALVSGARKATAPAKKTAAKKTTAAAKKTTAAAKKTATAAKKAAPAKKAPVKKAPVAAKKAPVKKAPAKKTTTAAKKAPAKKAPAKKAPAKKATAKKTTAKK